jgi:hypothetical protein
MKNKRPAVNALLARIDGLERELSACREEKVRLHEKVVFFTTHTWMTAGMKGETIIAQVIKRAATTGNASYDFGGDCRLEVKYSRLSHNGKGVWRWQWGTIFGRGGNKVYDRLILVGDAADSKHWLGYLDPACPFVLFDIAYDEVLQLVTAGGGAVDLIRLSSNASKATGKSSILYSQYQVTQETLESRYRVL